MATAAGVASATLTFCQELIATTREARALWTYFHEGAEQICQLDRQLSLSASVLQNITGMLEKPEISSCLEANVAAAAQDVFEDCRVNTLCDLSSMLEKLKILFAKNRFIGAAELRFYRKKIEEHDDQIRKRYTEFTMILQTISVIQNHHLQKGQETQLALMGVYHTYTKSTQNESQSSLPDEHDSTGLTVRERHKPKPSFAQVAEEVYKRYRVDFHTPKIGSCSSQEPWGVVPPTNRPTRVAMGDGHIQETEEKPAAITNTGLPSRQACIFRQHSEVPGKFKPTVAPSGATRSYLSSYQPDEKVMRPLERKVSSLWVSLPKLWLQWKQELRKDAFGLMQKKRYYEAACYLEVIAQPLAKCIERDETHPHRQDAEFDQPGRLCAIAQELAETELMMTICLFLLDKWNWRPSLMVLLEGVQSTDEVSRWQLLKLYHGRTLGHFLSDDLQEVLRIGLATIKATRKFYGHKRHSLFDYWELQNLVASIHFALGDRKASDDIKKSWTCVPEYSEPRSVANWMKRNPGFVESVFAGHTSLLDWQSNKNTDHTLGCRSTLKNGLIWNAIPAFSEIKKYELHRCESTCSETAEGQLVVKNNITQRESRCVDNSRSVKNITATKVPAVVKVEGGETKKAHVDGCEHQKPTAEDDLTSRVGEEIQTPDQRHSTRQVEKRASSLSSDSGYSSSSPRRDSGCWTHPVQPEVQSNFE